MRDKQEDLRSPIETQDQEADSNLGGHKKKRKIVKKYSCPEDNCDKSYSRAEHLYRHQLNHAPKNIYRCGFDGCERSFVRQDLCTRHRERHSKANSHLARKDALKTAKHLTKSSESSSVDETNQSISVLGTHDSSAQAEGSLRPSGVHHSKSTEKSDVVANFSEDFASTALDPLLASQDRSFQNTQSAVVSQFSISGGTEHVLSSVGDVVGSKTAIQHTYLPFGNVQHASSVTLNALMHQPSPHEHNNNMLTRPQFINMSKSAQSSHAAESYNVQNPNSVYPTLQHNSGAQFATPYARPGSNHSGVSLTVGSTPSLPPFGFPFVAPHNAVGTRSDSVTSFASKSTLAEYYQPTTSQGDLYGNSVLPDLRPTAMSIPVFNNDASDHAPLGDEFMGWLFSDERLLHSPMSQLPTYQAAFDSTVSQNDSHGNASAPRLVEPGLIHGVVDSGQPESLLSESRRKHLLGMIITDFRDDRHAEVTQHREKILQGNNDDDDHVLSLRMLQVYVSSFWLHIHAQLPILHRPTFSAETCPDLLLIAIMTLGASCLDKTHGYEVTQACTELAFFLAWHCRHKIFQDPEAMPPAKLWVFQALLLLEVFEKLFSKRSLHERAHVHHATTLTLMRRGSSLIGRSAADFSSQQDDPTRTPPGPNGSINTSGKNTPDAWWNYWISNEATRRTAFAAFIIDTTHATMFGHSAVMVAHEMRIPLPCDETLWSARSGAEVRQLAQSQVVRGLKPISFLEGLKKTLNNQPVRTNTFGRVTIMAGLLSVSWHMKMQDVRVSSLGVGKQGSWASQLMHAFDYWKQDFDTNLASVDNMYLNAQYHPHGPDFGNVFESRTVLHHLAHMAMHVDIIDCQIFAGAKRLLGRIITPYEHAAAVKRMKESWAPSARARDATFYALRFLSEVLVPEDHDHVLGSTHRIPSAFAYSARDDNLLNRPWVLYFATLVIWAYGFALDGPIAPPTYSLSTQNQLHDMQGFLRRVGGVKSPEGLQNVKHRNSCLGLLLLLRDMFLVTRWELLHEASDMLGNCAELLMPGTR